MTPDIRKERETALYEAALRLIAKGVNPAAMKVQQIADEAGIGKGTVYEYFASKDEILQGMALYCFDTEIARIAVLDGAMHHPARAGGRRDGLPAGSFRKPDGNLSGDRFQYWRTGEPPRYGRVCASPAWGAAQNHGSPAAKRGDQPRPAG